MVHCGRVAAVQPPCSGRVARARDVLDQLDAAADISGIAGSSEHTLAEAVDGRYRGLIQIDGRRLETFSAF